MKKILALFACVFIFTVLFVVFVSAEVYSGNCGETVTYTLNTETGEMTISGKGDMYDTSITPNYVPWNSNRSYIETVIIEQGVTSVCSYAFYNCYNLQKITIPNGIVNIEKNAFEGCSGLNSIMLPSSLKRIGNEAFYKCSSLIDVYFEGDVDDWIKIVFCSDDSNPMFYGDNLYFENKLVTEVVIPEGTTSIGAYTFMNCSSLIDVTIPDSVTSIGYCAFQLCGFDSVILPQRLSSIEGYAFSYCRNLTDITLPNSITSIGVGAFYCCSKLDSIVIPDSVQYIGYYIFEYCGSLKSVTIGDGVQAIPYRAFYYCSTLETIIIGNSVSKICQDSFDYCKSLKSVYIEDLSQWCGMDFYYLTNIINGGKDLYLNGELVTNLIIPENVERINSDAFIGYKNVTSVEISKNVTSIGSRAFYGCSNMSDVYYEGSKSDWSNISIESSNEPLFNATIHYNTSSVGNTGEFRDENEKSFINFVVYKNQNDSTKVADDYVICKDAIATINDTVYEADDNAIITIPNTGDSVIVSADGYYPKEISLSYLEKNPQVYLQQTNDTYPVLNSVKIGDDDILSSEIEFSLLGTDSVTFDVEVFWGNGTYGTIELVQENRRVTFPNNSLETVLSENFDVSKPIYIVATNNNLKATQKKLKISCAEENALNGWEFSLDDSFEGKVPSNVPFLGDKKFSLKVPKIPFEVKFEGKKFVVLLGLDLEKYENNLKLKKGHKDKISDTFLIGSIKKTFTDSLEAYKPSKYKELFDAAKTYKGEFGFEADVTVVGYMEGYINSDGKPEILFSRAMFNPSIGLKMGGQLYGPAYWEMAIKGEIEAYLNLHVNETTKAFVPNGSIGGKVGVQGGAWSWTV